MNYVDSEAARSIFNHFAITEEEVEYALTEDELQSFMGWLLSLAGDVRRYEEEIISRGEYLARQIGSTATYIEEGYHINSLGVLQASAVDYDRACSLRQKTVEDLRHAAALYREHAARLAG